MTADISQLWSLDVKTAITITCFIAIEATGVVQALKKKLNMHPSLICFIFCVVAAFMQSHWVWNVLSSIWNLIFLSFAVATLGAEGMIGVVRGLPKFFMSMLKSKLPAIENVENMEIVEVSAGSETQ